MAAREAIVAALRRLPAGGVRGCRSGDVAVDNACDQFLGFPSSSTYYNGAPRHESLVAPGTRFHWSTARLKKYGAPPLSSPDHLHWHSDTCLAPTTPHVIWAYNEVNHGDPECN